MLLMANAVRISGQALKQHLKLANQLPTPKNPGHSFESCHSPFSPIKLLTRVFFKKLKVLRYLKLLFILLTKMLKTWLLLAFTCKLPLNYLARRQIYRVPLPLVSTKQVVILEPRSLTSQFLKLFKQPWQMISGLMGVLPLRSVC